MAPMMTNSTPTNFLKRAPRSECQRKRQTQPNRRAFDPIAYAADLRSEGGVTDEAFQVTSEMRDSLYHRLEDEELFLPRETYDEAGAYVNEQLGNEIARELFGTESVVRRQAKADRQLQAALRLLRQTRTQQEALTSAVATQASGRLR